MKYHLTAQRLKRKNKGKEEPVLTQMLGERDSPVKFHWAIASNHIII